MSDKQGGGGREEVEERLNRLERRADHQGGEIGRLRRENRQLEQEVEDLRRHVRHLSMAGVHTATISGSGSDGTPAELDSNNRVQVKFQFEGKKNTAKAVVPTPWLLTGGGLQFSPRIGQDVLISFPPGDPHHPHLVGYLPSSSHPLPYDPSAASPQGTLALTKDKDGAVHNPSTANNYKTVLRSSPTGSDAKKNEIALVDDTTNPELTLTAQGDLRAYAGGDQYLTVAGDRTMVIEGNLWETIAKDHRKYVTGETHEVHVGDHEYEVYGEVTTNHHEHSSYWVWGDSETLMMGAEIAMTLGLKTDICVGGEFRFKFVIAFDFVLAGSFDFKFGGGTELQWGAYGAWIWGSEYKNVMGVETEMLEGESTKTIAGFENKIVEGQELTIITGISAEILDGIKQETTVLMTNDGEMMIGEWEMKMGDTGVMMDEDEMEIRQGLLKMSMADLHVVE